MYSANDWRSYRDQNGQSEYESFMDFLHHYDCHDYDGYTAEELSDMLYSCEHSWGTSPAAKALEKAYNAWYYATHKDKWGIDENIDEERMKKGQETLEGINEAIGKKKEEITEAIGKKKEKIDSEIDEKKENLRKAYEETKNLVKSIKDNPGQLKENAIQGYKDIKSGIRSGLSKASQELSKQRWSHPTTSYKRSTPDTYQPKSKPVGGSYGSYQKDREAAKGTSTRSKSENKTYFSRGNNSSYSQHQKDMEVARGATEVKKVTAKQNLPDANSRAGSSRSLTSKLSTASNKLKTDVGNIAKDLRNAKMYNDSAKTSRATANEYGERAQNAYVNLAKSTQAKNKTANAVDMFDSSPTARKAAEQANSYNTRANNYDTTEVRRLNNLKNQAEQVTKTNVEERNKALNSAGSRITNMVSWDYITGLFDDSKSATKPSKTSSPVVTMESTGNVKSDNARRNEYASGNISIPEVDRDAKKRRR